MGLFGALDTAASGAGVARVWLDVIADNVANLNTVRPADQEPFRGRMVVAESFQNEAGRGARAVSITTRTANPVKVLDPGNPLADEEGVVTLPVVDLSSEMTNLLIAQRSYQANLAVIDRARTTYQAALQIGVR